MVIPTIYSLIDDLTVFARRIAAAVLRPVPVPVSVPDVRAEQSSREI
jgi:hypothetical protein